MQNGTGPVILRLNSTVFPMGEPERAILKTLNPRLVEIEGASDEEISAHASEADAVIIVSAYLHAPVVARLKRCRLISRMGTGVDKIDIAAATAQGILVTNIPDFSTAEVADHTLALLLSVARQLKAFDAEMRQGKRCTDGKTIHRLAAQTIGIVGFGRIGKAIARRATGFGLRAIAYDPLIQPGAVGEGGVAMVTLDQLLAESDYVCLACPLTAATRGFLGMEQFRRMKRTAILINTARGELVVEKDLVAALSQGIIHSAALDVFGEMNVFAPGGFSAEHPLFKLDNVMLSPHVAALSEESLVDVSLRAAQAVVDVLSGRWPAYPVNPEVVPRFPLRREV